MCSAVIVLAAAGVAQAQDPRDTTVQEVTAQVLETEPVDTEPAETASTRAATAVEARLSDSHWQPQWERFHLVEGLVTLAAEGAAIAIYFAEPSREPRWRDPMPLDPEARDALRLDDDDARMLAVNLSDGLLVGMLVWPVLIDALLLGGIVGGDWDTTWQMMLIDAEALALAHFVTWFTTRFVGRVRPIHVECTMDDSCADRGVGPVASFVSGHTLMVYAASGLTCAHHLMNPWLTGSNEGAAVMCGSSLVLATAVGVMRVMTDLHWASDVAISALMGSTIGWGVPLAFHYLRFRPGLPGDIAIGPPAAGDAGLGVMGAF